MTNKRIGGTLNNWCVQGNRVFGTTSGDVGWADGTDIITSPIVKLDELANQLETKNTLYTLGTKSSINKSLKT